MDIKFPLGFSISFILSIKEPSCGEWNKSHINEISEITPGAELFTFTNPIAFAKYLNVESIISILQGMSGKEKSITMYSI